MINKAFVELIGFVKLMSFVELISLCEISYKKLNYIKTNLTITGGSNNGLQESRS